MYRNKSYTVDIKIKSNIFTNVNLPIFSLAQTLANFFKIIERKPILFTYMATFCDK